MNPELTWNLGIFWIAGKRRTEVPASLRHSRPLGVEGLIYRFPWHLDALILSIVAECTTIEGPTLVLVVAAAAVRRLSAVSAHSAPCGAGADRRRMRVWKKHAEGR